MTPDDLDKRAAQAGILEILAQTFDLQVDEFRHYPMEAYIQGVTTKKHIAKDGAGGDFYVLNEDGPVLYISSEGQTGVIAANLKQALEIIVTYPYWRDLVDCFDETQSDDARSALEIVIDDLEQDLISDIVLQDDDYEPDKFESEDTEFEYGKEMLAKHRAIVRETFSLEPLDDALGLLHKAITTLGDDIRVFSPNGSELERLEADSFVDDVDGNDLLASFMDTRLDRELIADVDASDAYEEPQAEPPVPIKAYDLELLPHEPKRGTDDNQGWVFGLPPGISTDQWPLDPVTGYPLMHGFTLLLPEDYRIHGPEFVALSFFATPADYNDGGADDDDELDAAVTGKGERPSNPDLAQFWDHAQNAHPHLHRMTDILDYAYAVILLTREEFDGPLAQPPRHSSNAYIVKNQAPEWMSKGSAMAHVEGMGVSDTDADKSWVLKVLGSFPKAELGYSQALRWTPRENDPNAGKKPMEIYDDEPAESGYQNWYYFENDSVEVENFVEHEWAKGLKPCHIGGTMRPAQAIPDMSAYYIEFEEYFGDYNFGGDGNGQLDIRDFKFDWACG